MSSCWDLVDKERDLSDPVRECILAEFGSRGKKALDAVDQGKVKRYLDFVVVVGQSGEYVVEDEFCECSDALFRGRGCWHVLAARIAALTGRYQDCPTWYQDTRKKE
ncbi:MAG: SWIM zinc finger family protein [Methanomicrobiales archaeon]|nr:SWIM zinc finger family protein [Methanomicrobiales archaeon]